MKITKIMVLLGALSFCGLIGATNRVEGVGISKKVGDKFIKLVNKGNAEDISSHIFDVLREREKLSEDAIRKMVLDAYKKLLQAWADAGDKKKGFERIIVLEQAAKNSFDSNDKLHNELVKAFNDVNPREKAIREKQVTKEVKIAVKKPLSLTKELFYIASKKDGSAVVKFIKELKTKLDEGAVKKIVIEAYGHLHGLKNISTREKVAEAVSGIWGDKLKLDQIELDERWVESPWDLDEISKDLENKNALIEKLSIASSKGPEATVDLLFEMKKENGDDLVNDVIRGATKKILDKGEGASAESLRESVKLLFENDVKLLESLEKDFVQKPEKEEVVETGESGKTWDPLAKPWPGVGDGAVKTKVQWVAEVTNAADNEAGVKLAKLSVDGAKAALSKTEFITVVSEMADKAGANVNWWDGGGFLKAFTDLAAQKIWSQGLKDYFVDANGGGAVASGAVTWANLGL